MIYLCFLTFLQFLCRILNASWFYEITCGNDENLDWCRDNSFKPEQYQTPFFLLALTDFTTCINVKSWLWNVMKIYLVEFVKHINEMLRHKSSKKQQLNFKKLTRQPFLDSWNIIPCPLSLLVAAINLWMEATVLFRECTEPEN